MLPPVQSNREVRRIWPGRIISLKIISLIPPLPRAAVVFLWTPALSPHGEDVPHGFIFATLMLASMVGSAFAGRLLSANRAPETYMAKVSVGGYSVTRPRRLVEHLRRQCRGYGTNHWKLDK
jgi:hypothetical protein